VEEGALGGKDLTGCPPAEGAGRDQGAGAGAVFGAGFDAGRLGCGRVTPVVRGLKFSSGCRIGGSVKQKAADAGSVSPGLGDGDESLAAATGSASLRTSDVTLSGSESCGCSLTFCPFVLLFVWSGKTTKRHSLLIAYNSCAVSSSSVERITHT
jgi:hypothetical protein